MRRIISRIFNLFILVFIMQQQGCISQGREKKNDPPVAQLMVLDPGHFHAALLQKTMQDDVDKTVYVFAPDGPEVKAHLALIDGYNNRKESPTQWREKVYIGPDYFDRLLKEKTGNVVVIAGNNRLKTDYIKRAVADSLNVLADKPMAISKEGFEDLKNAFAIAQKNHVLLYDIMTERYEVNNRLQKDLSQLPEVFGGLQKGTLQDPAVISESVHYFYKEVSGAPLIRPSWYFDVAQEGEGIVDVTTHLVDLVQWQCFPEVVLDYRNDIQVLSARHWPTVLTPAQFRQVTKKDTYPDFLKKDIKDSLLHVYANGEMNYTIKGVHTKVAVKWDFKAPDGAGDTYYSVLRGAKANLVIRQGREQQFQPVLYIEPVDKTAESDWNRAVQKAINDMQHDYPGLALKKSQKGWEVVVPDQYKIGHEQHFAQVVKKYIQYLKDGNMPAWETAGMLAKYYTTTQALEKALDKK